MAVKAEQMKHAKALFSGWKETIIWSCLDKTMGTVYEDNEENPKAAAATLGDFCFFAGMPDEKLIQSVWKEKNCDFLIMVPQDEDWAAAIENCFEKAQEAKARRTVRYATKKEENGFDRKKLLHFIEMLPAGYEIREIKEEVFDLCRASGWGRDLVSQFESYEFYRKWGLGEAVFYRGELVAGASSYSWYQGGIEIEIDTREDHRRKGLASACGAKLILNCLDRGLYPSWDAQNKGSLALAEKLGYHFECTYPVYEVTG